MRQKGREARSEVDLKALLQAAGLVGVGLVLVYIGFAYMPLPSVSIRDGTLCEVAKSVGASLVAAGLLSASWDLFLKRTFTSELVGLVGTTDALVKAGIQSVVTDYLLNIDWDQVLDRTRRLDILMAYGATWRGAMTPKLEALLHAKGKVRVLLPDPNNVQVVEELAARFGKSPADVKTKIQEACSDFMELGRKSGQLSKMQVFYIARCPLYSSYIADRLAVMSLYRHAQQRGGVPTFLLKKDATLYTFVRSDFDLLVMSSSTVKQSIS